MEGKILINLSYSYSSFLIIGILSSTITKSMNVHEMRSINSQLDKEFERYLVLDNENIRIKNLIDTENNLTTLNNFDE